MERGCFNKSKSTCETPSFYIFARRKLFDNDFLDEWLIEALYKELYLGNSLLRGGLQTDETFAEIRLELGGSP